MSGNNNLHKAKIAKNDEFYTQYNDIDAEMTAYVNYNPAVFKNKVILCPCDDYEYSNFPKFFIDHFQEYGVKEIICSCYISGEKGKMMRYNGTNTETYRLEGDGDFRSKEVTELRDESDIIITNGPFSLFREFIAWIMEGKKQFAIIGNQNAITYKEVFPLLKENKMWLGTEHPKEFRQPDNTYKKFGNILWFTNIDHGQRHEPLQLMTMADNLKYNQKLRKKLQKEYDELEYPHYDNYDAIEVPFTECIPSDYEPCWFKCDKANECPWAMADGMDNSAVALCEMCKKKTGILGVPVTVLDKFNPDQYRIIGLAAGNSRATKMYGTAKYKMHPNDRGGCGVIQGERCYARLLIQKV